MDIFALILALAGLVIALKILRALERIASELAELVHVRKGENVSLQRQNALQTKEYKKFLLEDPAREGMPPKKRHEAFRLWNEARAEEWERVA